MTKCFKNNLLFLLASLCLFSCGSKKDFVYLQGIENTKSYDNSTVYEPRLQPDDMLSIIVSAENPEVTIPFNMPDVSGSETSAGVKSYLVDNNGYIEFPVLGKLKMSGLTHTEANNKLVAGLSEYIKNPTVNLRIHNFKVSVVGEVNKPGTYTIAHERFTLLEAISMAGDIGIYGKRDNILIIREIEGKKTYTRVDITKPDFLNSPYYYLAQNDVIYIEPTKTKINSSVIGPNISIVISATSLLVSILIILFR